MRGRARPGARRETGAIESHRMLETPIKIAASSVVVFVSFRTIPELIRTAADTAK